MESTTFLAVFCFTKDWFRCLGLPDAQSSQKLPWLEPLFSHAPWRDWLIYRCGGAVNPRGENKWHESNLKISVKRTIFKSEYIYIYYIFYYRILCIYIHIHCISHINHIPKAGSVVSNLQIWTDLPKDDPPRIGTPVLCSWWMQSWVS